jgi:ribosome biogenesis protein Tsr3
MMTAEEEEEETAEEEEEETAPKKTTIRKQKKMKTVMTQKKVSQPEMRVVLSVSAAPVSSAVSMQPRILHWPRHWLSIPG